MEKFKNWDFAGLKKPIASSLQIVKFKSKSNFKGDANKIFQQIILPKSKDQIKDILLSKSFSIVWNYLWQILRGKLVHRSVIA
jgi:hypothetical protein